jgi:hypothetical protein
MTTQASPVRAGTPADDLMAWRCSPRGGATSTRVAFTILTRPHSPRIAHATAAINYALNPSHAAPCTCQCGADNTPSKSLKKASNHYSSVHDLCSTHTISVTLMRASYNSNAPYRYHNASMRDELQGLRIGNRPFPLYLSQDIAAQAGFMCPGQSSPRNRVPSLSNIVYQNPRREL